MDQRSLICFLFILVNSSAIFALTDSGDEAVLMSLSHLWGNTPSNWVGSDPCGNNWVGIKCNNSRVISIQLSSIGLKGSLSGDIGGFTELQSLDLSYNMGLSGSLPSPIGKLTKLTNLILVGCSFSGPIPDLSPLKQLRFLSLNSNQFTGGIPPSIGALPHLYWLDLADNQLTGTIPVSNGNTPGLDNLTHTAHFHFGNNRLSGTIPPQLFSSDMHLLHVLFDNNTLEGSIPITLGLVKSLEVVRLDRNLLIGSVPSNINNLTKVGELYLSNNKLTGPLPNLTGMDALSYVDLSNNDFSESDVPLWLSTLQSLTTVVMESIRIAGEVPLAMLSIPQMQTVRLKNNLFNGTLNISSYGNQLQLVDLRYNKIEIFVQGTSYNKELMLTGNPYCAQVGGNSKYCTDQVQSRPTYTTVLNCGTSTCSPDLDLSTKCICAYPYKGTLYFRAPSFSNLDNSSYYLALEAKLMSTFQSNQLPVDSVYLYNLVWKTDTYLEVGLKVFPSGALRFSQSDIPKIGFTLSNQTFKPPPQFGPFVFRGVSYNAFQEAASGSESRSLPLIIGASAGGFVLVLIIIFLIVYACRQKKKTKKVIQKNQPFASWDEGKSSGSVPQLKGARWFTFVELKYYTNNFSEANELGSGGYGKVYRGMLPTGQLVAVKRAQQDSVQGGAEFKTEIELLSRVHHKNLVSLVGFCIDKGEQMLVYEYIPNGSLKDSLSGKSGVLLDWKRRLRVALGAARGLAYLHELANPPIVHRDIKSSNIILDDYLNAKVADFGLCKSLSDGHKGHVTTQVKGTMGYLDPEYYMTQQLTEKSDIYSFGVLMLEMLTARKPIDRGRYIVREIKTRMKRSEDLYGLHELLDPVIASSPYLGGFEKFVDLAIQCVEEYGADRPTMSEVVKEIEGITKLAGMNPNADSTPTSASYEDRNSGYPPCHPYGNEVISSYGGSMPVPR